MAYDIPESIGLQPSAVIELTHLLKIMFSSDEWNTFWASRQRGGDRCCWGRGFGAAGV